jgi:hypothetical protein
LENPAPHDAPAPKPPTPYSTSFGRQRRFIRPRITPAPKPAPCSNHTRRLN